VRPVT